MHRFFKIGWTFSALLAAGLLAGCFPTGDDSKSGGPTGAAPGTKIPRLSASYVLLGDTLTTLRGYQYNYCDSANTLLLDQGFSADTEKVSIEGDVWVSWDSWLDTLYDTSYTTIVAIIQTGERYERVDAGSGIQGVWKLANPAQKRFLMGDPDDYPGMRQTEEDKRILDLFARYRQVTEDSIHVWSDLKTADVFIGLWNMRGMMERQLSDSARYAIKVTKVDAHTVRLKGLMSGETVTFSRDNAQVDTYKSSIPSHATLVYDPDAPITSCPSYGGSLYPAWYEDFLTANTREGFEDL